MSNEEKRIHVIEFLSKKTDWENWSKKFLLHGKRKGYKKLIVSSGSMSGVDKIPPQDEYQNAIEGGMDLDNKITKLGELNVLESNDSII